MKRIVTIIVMVTAFMSCQREELAGPAESLHVFKAYMEDVRNETKTMIGDDNQIVWSDGDEIMVGGYYGGSYEIESESVGTSEGIFTLTNTNNSTNLLERYCGESVNIAVYPRGIVTSDKEKHSNNELAANEYEIPNCHLAPTQSYCFDNFSKNSFPMVAVTTSPEDDVLNFKNLCGVMKLQLKGNAIIESIVLQGNDNEKLSGYFNVIASAGGLPRVIMADDAYESVRLDCGEGVKLDKDIVRNFYISIPPVVFEKGFKVTVTDTDGDKYVIEATVKNQVERSSILVMPEIDLADFAVESGDDEIIDFRDPVVRELLLRQGIDRNGDGDISYKEAALTTSLSFVVDDADDDFDTYDIVEFDEFQYFTGITDMTEMFFGCNMLRSIILPESIVEIGESAFLWCVSLRNVIIPNSVKIIGDGAFSGCISLETIDLPESLEIIDHYAFGECNSLETIDLPESLEIIDDRAFVQTKLVSIELPSSLINLGEYVFDSCHDLMEIKVKEGNPNYYSSDGVLYSNDGTLLRFPPAKPCNDYKVPEGSTSIGEGAFDACIQLQSISLPNTVEYIGDSAFYGCSELSMINIPEGVKSIGNEAFRNCFNLKSISLPSTLENIGNAAFDNCDELANVYISDIMKWCRVQFGWSITNDEGYSNPLCGGADLYLKGERVTELTIPADVTEVGNSFTGCGSIEDIILSEGVKSIGYAAFRNCFNLKSISLPSSLETIEEYVFYNCDNLSIVHISDLEKWCSVDCDNMYGNSNPFSKGADLYLNDDKVTDLMIPSSVRTLGNSFKGCGSITSVTIPATTTTIKDNAFEGCSNLENIYMMSETAMSVGHIGLDDRMYINVPADSHYSYLAKNYDVQNIVAYYYGKSWGLSGTFNEWGKTPDIEMSEKGGYYVAKGIELSSDTEFKFRLDNSWDINFGASSSAAVSANISNETESYGPNIMVTKPGRYDIYLSKHYDEYFIMTSGKSPDEL